MEWDLVIERNREALRRILAMLCAMAGPFPRFGKGGALGLGEGRKPACAMRVAQRKARPGGEKHAARDALTRHST